MYSNWKRLSQIAILSAAGTVLPANLFAADALSLNIGDNRTNAFFDCGEDVTVEIVPGADGTKAVDGEITVKITNDDPSDVTVKTFSLPGENRFVVKRVDPGFVRCDVTWSVNGKTAGSISRSIGFSADRIQPGAPEPEDYDEFWASLRKEAAALPGEITMTPLPEAETETTRFYTIAVPTLNHKHIYGYISIPKAEGKFPLIVHVPGAGPATDARNRYRWDDAITMWLNVHTYPASADAEENAKRHAEAYDNQEYHIMGIDNRDTFFYRDSFLGMDRAISFAETLPEYDGENIGIFGSSQGGGSALTLASMHPEMKAVFVNVPALCDHNGNVAGRYEGWPHGVRLSNDAEQQKKIGDALRYFDAAYAAKRITAPTTVVVGRIDDTCPPSSVYAMFNSLGSEDKVIINEIDMGHECRASWDNGIDAIHKYLVELNSEMAEEK